MYLRTHDNFIVKLRWITYVKNSQVFIELAVKT